MPSAYPVMYSQLIYFLVALVLFTLQQPGVRPLFSPLATFAATALAFLLYASICFLLLRRLQHSLRAAPQPLLTRRYHRIQGRLSILALGFVAIDTYLFNLKFYLQAIPGFDQSLTVPGLAGIGLYLLHLIWVWLWSHPLYQKVYRSEITLPAFLKGNLAFVSAILIPWFLLSGFSDLLQVIRLPAFMAGETAQLALLGVLLLIFVLFAPWLVVRLWRCKPLPSGPVRTELEGFCRQNGFALGDFLLWPLFGDEMLTAGIIGILPRWRYILLTRGLPAVLETDELKAVVAHEMGHVRRFHIIIYLVFFICYSLLAYSFHDILLLLFLSNDLFLQWAIAHDTLHLTLFSLLYTTPTLMLLVLYFRYIFGFFMRNSERQADLYALGLIGSPLPLISSLQKIAFYSGHIEDLPSWHHFSIRQRIDFLMRSYQRPELVHRHNRKLYGAILLFLLLTAGLSVLGSELRSSSAVKHWKTQIQARLLERQIDITAAGPETYAAYGGLLLELGRHETALSFLTKAFEMAPRNATVLNNLAWLYATSPPPFFRPDEALRLAYEAVALESQPYALDTLAEAYYANGRYQDAVAAIQEALAKNPENREYYLQQKEKFERAVGEGKAR